MTPADALREAFWTAMPANTQRFRPTDDREDGAMWQALAEHGLACARAAYRYGDRGELLVRNTAFNLRTRFAADNADVLKRKGPSPERVDFEAMEDGVWVACARALLAAAQAERSRPQAEAA